MKCTDEPSALKSACHEFVSAPYTTGFQTGMLTPILNALRPDAFIIINNKSRGVINYLAKTSFKQNLIGYHVLNTAGHALIADVQGCMRELSTSDAPIDDLFDMFCHWLVAEKRFAPVYTGASRIRGASGRDVAVTVPDDTEGDEGEGPEQLAPEGVADPQSRASYKIQAALAEVGAKMGFQIWIPRNDRSRVLEHCPSVSLLNELPLNYIDVTLKTIEQIDVIWIKRHSIARAFEVEHTTAIYSGLLRMADLLSLQPDINIRLHIVAPDEKHDKVMREIKRPIFSSLEKAPLYQRCSFLSYSSVVALCKLPRLEYMSDLVLKEYEEFAEEE